MSAVQIETSASATFSQRPIAVVLLVVTVQTVATGPI